MKVNMAFIYRAFLFQRPKRLQFHMQWKYQSAVLTNVYYDNRKQSNVCIHESVPAILVARKASEVSGSDSSHRTQEVQTSSLTIPEMTTWAFLWHVFVWNTLQAKDFLANEQSKLYFLLFYVNTLRKTVLCKVNFKSKLAWELE